MNQSLLRAPWGALALLLIASPTLARDWDDCHGWSEHDGEGRYCETRELTLGELPGSLTVDARRNGGISVVAWDRAEISVDARIQAWDRHEADARRIVETVRIELGSTVRAEGPNDDHWSVSYRIHNGGLSVTGIRGDLRLGTQNGGISLDAVAGDVEARTTNGGVRVRRH